MTRPTGSSGSRLGIDFGTTHTVAALAGADGRPQPLLFDASFLLPSAVFAETGGRVLVGQDAARSARLDPTRFEPNPKRRIDDGMLLLGDREVPVGDLVMAVIARVAEEWDRTVGRVRPEVTLTCPAMWGATRRRLLADAAQRAGFDGVRLVAEPVAAATYFAKVLGREVPIGSAVVVHDFGAGTFDASVVARKATGFEVLAVDGRDDIGGLDVDAAIVAHLEKTYADRDRVAWARLENPSTAEERRAKRQLWDDVRVAKERLSRSPSADLMLPLLDIDVHLTRAELEQLATPILEQTVRVTQGVMRWAKLSEGQVAGVFLVGGSSRMPLMATLLHRALGEAPEVIEQPELVVAEGSILAGEALLATAPPAPGPATSQMRLGDLSGGSAPRPVSPATPPGPPAAAVLAPGSTRLLPPEELPSAAPVSTPPVSAPPVSAPPAGQISAPPAGAVPAQPQRSVGRVIVPGAQPPSGRPRVQVPPPASTKPMPRFEEPTAPPAAPTYPPAQGGYAPPPPGPSYPPQQPPPRYPAARPRYTEPAPPPPTPRPALRADYPLPSMEPPRRRRPGFIVRAIRVLVIIALLVVVPVGAGVFAFAAARDEPPAEVVNDIVDWFQGQPTGE